MQVDRGIFKAYDIRGILDESITPEFARGLGKAFVTFMRRERKADALTVVVGRDMRPSSVELQRELIAGMTSLGAHVLDIGLVSTPAFYFGVGHLDADCGVMVSASHNPAEYNGFKMVRNNAIPVSGDTGIKDLADLMEREDFASELQGSVEEVAGIPEAHVEMEFAFADVKEFAPLKIVADSANGMGAQYLDLMLGKMPNASVTRMFWEFDGSFPNHEADPFKPENTEAICQKVKEVGADLGIATDGDGDRIFFIDDNGDVVEPAMLRGIIAQLLLRRFPGATICYDIRPGKITEDMIREAGGVPVVTRVGHALIKEAMRKHDAVYAGESSGHFYVKFPNGFYEGPVTTALLLMEELRASGKKLSEIVAPLRRYVHSGEINFRVEDKLGVIAKLKERFADAAINELDGVTFIYPDFWFNVRMANTEPLLRLNLEAVDMSTMTQRRDEISAIMQA